MPANKVVEWLDHQSAETLYITTVTRAELRFGVLRLPNGKRKNALATQIERVLELFKDRTLDFDSVDGKRAVAPDAYIAACAATRGFAVATRNGSHFEHLGVRLIDPWQ